MTESSRQSEIKVAETSQPSIAKDFCASIFPKDPLPKEFVQGVQLLERSLDCQVCMFVQNISDYMNPMGDINPTSYRMLFEDRQELEEGKPVAVLIDSPGGSPGHAYKMAKLFQKRCGGFYALVPNYAKSAATLLTLGAERIILGNYGELGPLDMQVQDTEGEERISALNHVQTLERLSAYALNTMDQTIRLLIGNSGKKLNSIMPMSMNFTASVVRPLLENIDVVRYTEMSRLLKIGEDYAIRLLAPHCGQHEAEQIAAKLVSNYPEHAFVIDYEEAISIGLNVELPSDEVSQAFTMLLPHLDRITALGRLRECA